MTLACLFVLAGSQIVERRHGAIAVATGLGSDAARHRAPGIQSNAEPVAWHARAVMVKVRLDEILGAAVARWVSNSRGLAQIREAFARDDVATAPASAPPLSITVSTPSFISQPLAGKDSLRHCASRSGLAVPEETPAQVLLCGGQRIRRDFLDAQIPPATWVPSCCGRCRCYEPEGQ